MGAHSSVVGWGYKPEGYGYDFQLDNLIFQLTESFHLHYILVVDWASNRNEYQEFSLG
jgi:hypothetical protein